MAIVILIIAVPDYQWEMKKRMTIVCVPGIELLSCDIIIPMFFLLYLLIHWQQTAYYFLARNIKRLG
jgi:hypothetical protein